MQGSVSPYSPTPYSPINPPPPPPPPLYPPLAPATRSRQRAREGLQQAASEGEAQLPAHHDGGRPFLQPRSPSPLSPHNFSP
jgi:hypothetical protein